MSSALTNFPNGISTSVVTLTGGEAGSEYGLEGSASPVSGFGVNDPAIMLHGIVDLNSPNPPAVGGGASGVRIYTEVIGPANSNASVQGLAVMLDAQGLVAGAFLPTFAGLLVGFAGLNASKFDGNIWGMLINGMSIGAASTGVVAVGLEVNALSFDSSYTGSSSSSGLNVHVPTSSTTGAGTVTNYGISIVGNGHANATQNWALFSNSTAPSSFAGPIIQKPAVSTIPVNNGEMTVSATNNTTLTIRLKGTDGTVRSGTIPLV